MWSPAQCAHCLYPAHDVVTGIGGISLADVRQRIRVSEYLEGLLDLGQVVGADQDRGRAPVAGEGDAFVLVLDAVNDLAEVVTDLPERLKYSWPQLWRANGRRATAEVPPCGSGSSRAGRTDTVASFSLPTPRPPLRARPLAAK